MNQRRGFSDNGSTVALQASSKGSIPLTSTNFDGVYGVAVSIKVCEISGTGSTPVRHPKFLRRTSHR